MQRQPKSPEYASAYFDYLKHLSTLSTGSIVLEIAFLDKAFSHPHWKAFAVISLVAFTVSVVGSVILYTLGLNHSIGQFKGEGAQVVGCWSLMVTWAGFLGGITALTIFAIRNILAL
jgi:hypothetical protein